jgi:hypothetical protein
MLETLTAFSVIKILWETLEILHMLHVCHITGKAGYKGGSSIKQAIQKQRQKWQDEKNPGQELERKAETRYDFQATRNATQAIQEINHQAEAYLTKLNDSVCHLEKAKEYFLGVCKPALARFTIEFNGRI